MTSTRAHGLIRIVVVVSSGVLLFGCGDGEPTSSPQTRATTIPVSQSPPPLFDGDPAVAAGMYSVDTLGTPLDVTVPGGWETFQGFALVGPQDSYVAFWNVGDVARDACRWRQGDQGIGTTVDDLVSGLQAQGGTDTESAKPITINDVSGQGLTLSAAAGLNVATCDGGEVRPWTSTSGAERFYAASGQSETVWILDLGERRGVINFGAPGALSPETRSQLAAIVRSISFRGA